MKSSSILKISIFFLLTAVFISGLIAYSHSRGFTGKGHGGFEAAVSVNSDDVSRRYEQQFSVSDGGEVVVDADAGTVKIDSWDKNEVSVIVEIEGGDSRAEQYKVEFKQEGNTVYIIGKIRDRSFFKWHIGDLEAYYTIRTPKNFNTTVKTSGGNVEASELNGKVDYSTSGGNIRVKNIVGETVVSTSGGNVEVFNVKGEVDAETSGGNVFCEDVDGDVKGYTSGGDVDFVGINGKVKGGTSGGNVRVKITGENKGIDVETSGGDIDIFVKDGTAADIEAETSGGSVDCELPVTVRGKVRESELHGKINGGGNPIRAGTSGGNIRIARLN